MKLLPESTSFLLFLLLLVELPVLAMSRPTPATLHTDVLLKLMLRLRNTVDGVLRNPDTQLPFEHNIPSLPTVNFRPQDLISVEMNTTLSQLSSGLHSFKLHFDWLQYWENQFGFLSHETKETANLIQVINTVLQKQMPELPPQNTTLSLPPLTSTWDIKQTFAVIHKRLQRFCDWYIRALRVLIHTNKQRL